MLNPWLNFESASAVKSGEYLHDLDKAQVVMYNLKARSDSRKLLTHMLPEPWAGAIDAPVVVLQGNPGANEDEARLDWRPTAAQRQAALATLAGEKLDYPLYWLDPKLSSTDGGRWSEQRLKKLIEAAGRDSVSRSLLLLETYAYHSRQFASRITSLPTQQYTDYLLQQAIARDALVVIVRSKKYWMEKVPALAEHEMRGLVLTTSSWQNASLSPGNLKAGYELLLSRLR